MKFVLSMYNVHSYFSLKSFLGKSVHYTQQNTVYLDGRIVLGDKRGCIGTE